MRVAVFCCVFGKPQRWLVDRNPDRNDVRVASTPMRKGATIWMGGQPQTPYHRAHEIATSRIFLGGRKRGATPRIKVAFLRLVPGRSTFLEDHFSGEKVRTFGGAQHHLVWKSERLRVSWAKGRWGSGYLSRMDLQPLRSSYLPPDFMEAPICLEGLGPFTGSAFWELPC